MPEQWTLMQAANQLKVTRFTVMRWLKEGRVPGMKIGRRWLIPADEVRRMLDPIAASPGPQKTAVDGIVYVIRSNDFLEGVALSQDDADRVVTALKIQHGEPVDSRSPYIRRYIRSCPVRLVDGRNNND